MNLALARSCYTYISIAWFCSNSVSVLGIKKLKEFSSFTVHIAGKYNFYFKAIDEIFTNLKLILSTNMNKMVFGNFVYKRYGVNVKLFLKMLKNNLIFDDKNLLLVYKALYMNNYLCIYYLLTVLSRLIYLITSMGRL